MVHLKLCTHASRPFYGYSLQEATTIMHGPSGCHSSKRQRGCVQLVQPHSHSGQVSRGQTNRDLRNSQENHFQSVLFATKSDLQDATGSVQLCAGQIAGTEAAVHAMRAAFQKNETEAVLLVDTSNAFNSLNLQVALHNIRHLCPSLATVLTNIYRDATELFVDGPILSSEEVTTQGDPLAMPMYALATIPLIRRLSDTSNVVQVWYADDASASGRFLSLRN